MHIKIFKFMQDIKNIPLHNFIGTKDSNTFNIKRV